MTGREKCTENASLTPIGSPAPMSSLCAARTTCVTQAARSWLPTIQCCSGSIDAAEGAGTCFADGIDWQRLFEQAFNKAQAQLQCRSSSQDASAGRRRLLS